MRPLVVGVDVGGTFTDVFVLDAAAGRIEVVKVPSTRGDQSRGFIDGIRAGAGGFDRIATIVHGTTVGTNALLERKVARTGVITTRGFRDVLEMRRRDRPRTWGLFGTFAPLIDRDLRIEVDERVLADGTVLEPVDPGQVRAAAARLLESGCESVCIFFVNAYANDANERAALEALVEVWPNGYRSASHQILPEIREFERASTTSLNAALQPVVGHYLGRLDRALEGEQFGGQLLVVQSNGGVMSVDTASERPVRTALSGPAAGVIACAHIASESGFPNVITGDMGGTSFDVSLVADGRAAFASQTAIEFGMVVRTPMIEIQTIGAGGGSIASVDESGLLQVGPESAGSDPGPVCYGLGNDRPTVTDANVVLGRINADRPIGGRKRAAEQGAGADGAGAGLARLDVEAARAAIERAVARPLGLGIEAAAEAILTVANAKMAGAIRVVSIERGYDPQRFAYMPFGGGGALHVCAMMREVGVARGLIPRYPGVTSAVGCVIADMRHDFVQTVNRGLGELDEAELAARADTTLAEGRALLASAGIDFEQIDEEIELDMLYQGQTHTVSVPCARARLDRAGIREAFEAAYAAAFGRTLGAIAVRILNLRVAVIGRRRKFDLGLLAPRDGRPAHQALLGTRSVWHDGVAHDTPVYERMAIAVGERIDGPALFEQPDTTIWLEPGFRAEVDRLGNLVIGAHR